MNRIRGFLIFMACFMVIFISCVRHEVLFRATSEIRSDGTVLRKGSMEIRISGERDTSEDSLTATQFYDENYVIPDENLFTVSRACRDSILVISWEGEIMPGGEAISDYIHRSENGSTAINNISIKVINRWIYKDIIYKETFSDPVDTVKYFPLIRSRLSGASELLMRHSAFGGIRKTEEAQDLLRQIETVWGIDLFRRILADPDAFDSLSALYDDQISGIADSLAGFEGVRQNPDFLNGLIHDYFDAAWDTLLSDHPGLLGSFGFGDMDIHDFTVELSAPGCVRNSNSDTTIGNMSVWSFNRLDFFARDYNIELTARRWLWPNVALTVVVIAAVMFFLLKPVRRKEIG